MESEDPLRKWRHDLRGRANTLILCTSALKLATERAEQLEYLDEILLTTDKIIALLDHAPPAAAEEPAPI